MTKMNLFMARHGETDWNIEPAKCQGWSDIPLNKRGEKQAQELADLVKTKNIDLIICSHLLRAKQTASIVAENFKVDVKIDEGLAEAKKGLWEGMTFNSIESEYSDIWSHWLESPATAPVPDGETINEVLVRAVKSISRIIKEGNGENILLISHGGPISALRCYEKEKDLKSFHDMHPNNGQIFDLDISPFIISDIKVIGYQTSRSM